MIRTLAFQLADFNPTFAAKLAARIERSPDITTSALDMQFQHLLEEPLAELARELDLGPIVIVLDALDECGTAETRAGAPPHALWRPHEASKHVPAVDS